MERGSETKAAAGRHGLLGCLVLLGLLLSSITAVQGAPIQYAPPAIPSDTVSFTVVNESSSTDAVPLYGAPTTPSFNDTLTFDNLSAFAATSTNGSPAIDFIDGQLNVTVQANPGQFITGFEFSEFGDFSLARLLNPTGAASVFPTTPGLFITVREVNGVAVNLGPTNVPLVYTPTPGYTFDAVETVKTGTWSAQANYLFTTPNVTRFELTINNQLYAASETGTSASIAKKGVDLAVVSSPVFVPEPGILSGLAFLLLAMRRRR